MDTRQEEARDVLKEMVTEQMFFYSDQWPIIARALTEIRMSTRFIMLEPSVVIPRVWDILTATTGGVAMEYITDLTFMFNLCYSQPLNTLVDSIESSVVSIVDPFDTLYATDIAERVVCERNQRELRGALLRNNWFIVVILICVHFNHVIPKVMRREQK